MLNNHIATLTKEKDELSSTIISTQREFDAYRVACKTKHPKIDENEIFMLKTKINDLGNILKECAFNNTKLEEMLSKKHMHTSHVQHDKPSHAKTPHVHHANTSHVNQAKTPHVHKSHVHKPHPHYAFNMEEFINVLLWPKLSFSQILL